MLKFFASFAVILAFCSLSYSQATNKFAAAGIDDENEVKVFFAKFQKAVAENDKKTVASMVTYPIRVSLPSNGKNGPHRLRAIETKAAFLKAYDRIFNDAYKQIIVNAKYEDLWARDQGVATPNGELWMSGNCKDKKCKNSDLKVITLNGVVDKSKEVK